VAGWADDYDKSSATCDGYSHLVVREKVMGSIVYLIDKTMEMLIFFAIRAVQLFCLLIIIYIICIPQKSYDSWD